MKSFTIYCPNISPTGGPESLHNLAFNFRKIGFECKIATHKRSLKFKEYFSIYKPEYIPIDSAYINRSFVILPEVYTHYLSKFESNNSAIWWLSFLNHQNSLNLKYKLRNFGLKGIFKHDQLKRKINIKNLYHFMQTNSSKNYLYTKYDFNKNNIFDLESPLNPIYYEQAKNIKLERENSIVLNSAKLSIQNINFIKNYFEKNQYKVNVLKNNSREEVMNILKDSKFFLDLGPHPGQERLPREAISMGCLPIVGFRGTASNYRDLPLPYHSKIQIFNRIQKSSLQKAHHIMEEILQGADYGHEGYRDYVLNQPKRFEKQLGRIIKSINNL